MHRVSHVSGATSPQTLNLTAPPGGLGVVVDWVVASVRASTAAVANVDVKDTVATRFKAERQQGSSNTMTFDYIFPDGAAPRVQNSTPQVVLTTTGTPVQLYLTCGYHYEPF